MSAVRAEPDRFGRVLAAARRHRGLTQADLAVRLGVAADTVGRWERGANVPDILFVGPLCRALRVRPELFVDLPLRRLERYFVEEHDRDPAS